MAQGSVRSAEDWYAAGLHAARRHFPEDAGLLAHGQVLARELDLERNRVPDGETGRLPKSLLPGAALFAPCAAASAVAAELALLTRGVNVAMDVASEVAEQARKVGHAPLGRYAAALRVDVLAGAGRVGEAEAEWRAAALPATDAGCLDLVRQSWREMEMLSCARLRLFAARGSADDGRRLAHALDALTAERGLRRTRMRVLALAMAIEESADDRDAALDRALAFLALYRVTDYTRPVIRVRDAAVDVLSAVLDDDVPITLREPAQAVLAAVRAEAIAVPALSEREEAVLAGLASQTDAEIAAALGLTAFGVRYHIRHLFEKLGARNRHAAVERARSLGLLRRGP